MGLLQDVTMHHCTSELTPGLHGIDESEGGRELTDKSAPALSRLTTAIMGLL